MAYKDVEQRKAASKRHYEQNKQYYIERNRRCRKELSTIVNEIKESTPCADCKQSYPYYVMDFDHLEGSEKLEIVSFLCKTGRIGAMKREIAKCELVCSNCHRERTHQRQLKAVSAKIIVHKPA